MNSRYFIQFQNLTFQSRLSDWSFEYLKLLNGNSERDKVLFEILQKGQQKWSEVLINMLSNEDLCHEFDFHFYHTIYII